MHNEAAAGNGLGTASHQQSCSFYAATASRRRGNDLGTTIEYLRKVYRRESCLASVQMRPVSPPRHADALCLLYLSDDVVSPYIYIYPRLTSLRMCVSTAPLLFVLDGRFSSLGYHFQV
jgi:hypothetical protein